MPTTNDLSGGVSSSIFQFGPYGSGERTLWPDLNLNMESEITLPMIRLDTLLKGNDLEVENYDYWVVDLQGAEKLALDGAGDFPHAALRLKEAIPAADFQAGRGAGDRADSRST